MLDRTSSHPHRKLINAANAYTSAATLTEPNAMKAYPPWMYPTIATQTIQGIASTGMSV